MLFTTDQQTLDDLNIFGHHGSQSVYGIFNRTHTRGGGALLADMFRYPLSDHDAINQRSGEIQALAGLQTSFPFNAGLFDAIDTYLANSDARTQLINGPSSLAAKLERTLTRDGDTEMIIKGVQSLASLWKEFFRFVIPHYNGALTTQKTAVLACLEHPALADLLQHKGPLPTAALATYDQLFRFRHRELVQRLLQHVYLLDAYLAVAQTATAQRYSFPRALAGNQPYFHLQGVYHPQLTQPVPNDVQMCAGNNLLFLTGANMAGKSTFMKSLSIALYLAHMGFPVPAKTMEFTPLEGIYTTINLPDNLGMGASHFYAEVLRVKKMAQEAAAGKRIFVLFDELFRGTNVKDAYDGTIAITRAFAGKANCLFVLSTHIVEAGPVLQNICANIGFFFLPTQMDGPQPVYTYQLTSGITDDRHGMIIIRNEGILQMLEAGLQQKN